MYPPASNQKNHYEKAIIAVGRILANYDSDGLIPTWGFGAKYGSTVRHCFQCGNDEEVQGVEGVLDAYRAVLNTPLTMSFPTVFTEVIRTAVSYAQNETVRYLALIACLCSQALILRTFHSSGSGDGKWWAVLHNPAYLDGWKR